MLEVQNVTKKYGNITAVDNLSFTVEEGCIFGLLGLNGAGKTTTFRMILGLIDDYDGKILLNGKKIDYKVTDIIGFLTEERSLLTKLTVDEQIKCYGTLKSLDEKTIEERLDYWLERFNIKEYKSKIQNGGCQHNAVKAVKHSSVTREYKTVVLYSVLPLYA